MKKRKLLCLLTAALAFTVPFSACKDDKDVVVPVEHELWQYFAAEEEVKPYSNVYKIDGAMQSYDETHNLAVIETQDLNNDNVVTTKYSVYDLSQGDAGKEIFTQSVRNLYNEENPDELTVEIKYPLIEVMESGFVEDTSTVDPDDGDWEAKYSYYLIKEEGTQLLVSGIEDYTYDCQTVNNLYVCEIGEKVYWINQDVEVLRTLNKAIIDESYSGLSLWSSFDAEFNGYLYSWNTVSDWAENPLARSIQVFNKEGVCSMQYTYPNDVAMADVFVLNNGNIFVQEMVSLEEDAKDYDYKLYGSKMDMVSKIIDFKTGEVTELDLNFVVSELESQYAGRENTDFSLQLKEGKQNQAVIQYYNESGLANRTQYVVLDNEMNVEYTVKNDTMDVMHDHGFEMINKDYYGAYTTVNGISGAYLFDLDGNVKCKLPENLVGITKDYIVTDYAIYDLDMNLVFDVENSTFGSNRGDSYECYVYGDKILMLAKNYLTGSMRETYIFDSATKQPVLLSDGIKTVVKCMDELYAETDRVNGTISLYGEGDKMLLKLQGFGSFDPMTLEDVMVVAAEVDGKDVCYVLK